MADPADIDSAFAVSVLAGGGVVAFPTETSWGLAVDPGNPEAMEALFALKARPVTKPVPCVVADREQLGLMISTVPDPFVPLINSFWPGPLTLLFPARAGLLPGLSDERNLVGLRLSSHPLAQALPRAFGGPLTATSANPSGAPPALTSAGVRRYFGEAVTVLSDLTCPGGASTIVASSGQGLVIVRQGMISEAEIFALKGQKRA